MIIPPPSLHCLSPPLPSTFLSFHSLPPSPYMSTGGAAFVLPPLTPEQTVDINSPSILFDCLTAGNIPPVTSHSWTFNGELISPNGSKYTLYSNGSLAVNDIQVDDAGMYTCTPQNSLGSSNSSSVTLIVNGKLYLGFHFFLWHTPSCSVLIKGAVLIF